MCLPLHSQFKNLQRWRTHAFSSIVPPVLSSLPSSLPLFLFSFLFPFLLIAIMLEQCSFLCTLKSDSFELLLFASFCLSYIWMYQLMKRMYAIETDISTCNIGANCVANNYVQECEGGRKVYQASVSFRPLYPLHTSAHGLLFFLEMSYC